MIIKKLFLQDYRNYQKRDFDFLPEVTLLVGVNAAGKTNVLEAVYLLASGKSPRVSLEQEMIGEGREMARVHGEIFDEQDEMFDLEIVLTRGSVLGRATAKKRYLINKVPRRMNSFVGLLKAVFFRPEDLEIILGSPSKRRNYLDNLLIQVDFEYRRSLLTYKKGIKQRNKILMQLRENETDRRQLYFWDQLIIKNGQVITAKRQELIDFVNSCHTDKELCLHLDYDKSVISKTRLEQYKDTEVAAAKTLVGPHRDDFMVKTDSRNLAYFGSRGEQRLAVLSLKLSELEFIREKTKQKPVLLLDDIFSELDEAHRNLVFKATKNHQTIMSTTETDWLDKSFLDKIKIIKINN